jgi:hypothetical protein
MHMFFVLSSVALEINNVANLSHESVLRIERREGSPLLARKRARGVQATCQSFVCVLHLLQNGAPWPRQYTISGRGPAERQRV